MIDTQIVQFQLNEKLQDELARLLERYNSEIENLEGNISRLMSEPAFILLFDETIEHPKIPQIGLGVECLYHDYQAVGVLNIAYKRSPKPNLFHSSYDCKKQPEHSKLVFAGSRLAVLKYFITSLPIIEKAFQETDFSKEDLK